MLKNAAFPTNEIAAFFCADFLLPASSVTSFAKLKISPHPKAIELEYISQQQKYWRITPVPLTQANTLTSQWITT